MIAIPLMCTNPGACLSSQVVGTHSILGRKVDFPNLGLLVVDEEQKFGVQQKEKLKVRGWGAAGT